MRPPNSIIILLAGMAVIAIGAAQIAPSVVASRSGRASVAAPLPVASTSSVQMQAQTSSQNQASPPAPSAPIVSPSITPRGERELREDD